jgi:large subunit ribosomal protein L21
MSENVIHAVVNVGGKQFLVKEGEKIVSEKLEGVAGDKKVISEVLMIDNGTDTVVGTPFVEKASVEFEILAQGRGEKIRVAKFTAKSRYRKVTGHRQSQTELVVTKINSK